MMGFLPDQATLHDYYIMGGFVMPPLVVVAVLLWYALVYRALKIKSSRTNPRELVRLARRRKKKIEKLNSISAISARSAVAKARVIDSSKELKAAIDAEFDLTRESMAEHRTLVRTLVAIAPLLGLLGTVDGMIETFNSLSDMALFSHSGGIAGGISKALFTTQMGLAISIPGLLMGRMIERKEQNINRELDQIRDLVCAAAHRYRTRKA
jgi:biopolymer transport protein ExbB